MSCLGYDPLKMHPQAASPVAASVEIQRELKRTFDRLMAGENRDECNAPMGSADNAVLCRDHATSLHQLLRPLWQFQMDNIRELLGRAERGQGGHRHQGGGYGFGGRR
jgi:hypothetical protein